MSIEKLLVEYRKARHSAELMASASSLEVEAARRLIDAVFADDTTRVEVGGSVIFEDGTSAITSRGVVDIRDLRTALFKIMDGSVKELLIEAKSWVSLRRKGGRS